MKGVSMAKQPLTSLKSPFAMPIVGWSAVKLVPIGLWNSGNAFSGVLNLAVRRTYLRSLPPPM